MFTNTSGSQSRKKKLVENKVGLKHYIALQDWSRGKVVPNSIFPVVIRIEGEYHVHAPTLKVLAKLFAQTMVNLHLRF